MILQFFLFLSLLSSSAQLSADFLFLNAEGAVEQELQRVQEKKILSTDVKISSHNHHHKAKHCKKHKHTCPTGPRGENGFDGPTGPTGATGSFNTSYGRLNFSTQTALDFSGADTWLAIPFDAFSPQSRMSGSTTSPATLIIQEAGVYTVNVCLYFSSEDPDEGLFVPTTYTLGTKFNIDSIISQADVFAGEAGEFSINYSDLIQLNVADEMQFYIKVSAVGEDPPNNNHVELLRANANLVKIGS